MHHVLNPALLRCLQVHLHATELDIGPDAAIATADQHRMLIETFEEKQTDEYMDKLAVKRRCVRRVGGWVVRGATGKWEGASNQHPVLGANARKYDRLAAFMPPAPFRLLLSACRQCDSNKLSRLEEGINSVTRIMSELHQNSHKMELRQFHIPAMVPPFPLQPPSSAPILFHYGSSTLWVRSCHWLRSSFFSPLFRARDGGMELRRCDVIGCVPSSAVCRAREGGIALHAAICTS